MLESWHENDVHGLFEYLNKILKQDLFFHQVKKRNFQEEILIIE